MARAGIVELYHGVLGLLGFSPPGRSLQIFPDDIFLVSFPKSGNTWTRFLAGNLMFPDRPVTFANIHISVPDPTGTLRRDFKRIPRPRMIKSHDCFDPRYPRVIYVVRDPRDVVISQYHYYRKLREIPDNLPIDAFVGRFMAGETWPCGSWGQHVLTWVGASQGNPRFLLLRYEDMLADTSRELRRIAVFIGLNITAEQIANAVERSSKSRMQELERAQGQDLDRMMGTESRKDLTFVRSGVSGSWRKDLPMPMVEQIEAAWGPLMRHLGYQLATRATSEEYDYASLGIHLASRTHTSSANTPTGTVIPTMCGILPMSE